MRKIASPGIFLSEIQSIAEYAQTGTPSREKLASLLVDLADRVSERGILATEFPTENALKKYLKDHPGADPKNHSVEKHDKKSPKKLSPDEKEAKTKKLKDLFSKHQSLDQTGPNGKKHKLEVGSDGDGYYAKANGKKIGRPKTKEQAVALVTTYSIAVSEGHEPSISGRSDTEKRKEEEEKNKKMDKYLDL
jgi:hypothetical protein